MSLEHVSHYQLSRFAKEKVNLSQEKASEYKSQAKRLIDRLDEYLRENPDFSLKRMMISGSLAKGTPLKSLNDIDVACYIDGVNTPTDIPKLINFLVEKLRIAFPNFSPDQVEPKTYSVTVSFRSSGLDVDVVPIIYSEPDWFGKLVSQRDGSLLETNIPLHIDFIKKRKTQQIKHFTQIVRLIKFWIRERKKENEDFRFKSFIVELICAKLSDDGFDFSDYLEALQHFFTYIIRTNLRESIVFSDYYRIASLPVHPEPVKIIDPVNKKNNTAKLYTSTEADLIVEAATEAGDAIDAAIYATTKEKTIYYWRKIFGPSFNV